MTLHAYNYEVTSTLQQKIERASGASLAWDFSRLSAGALPKWDEVRILLSQFLKEEP